MTDYPYLPAGCRTGRCDHEPDRCLRFRSRRCESGECRHASQNLLCAVNYSPMEPTATLSPMGYGLCGIDQRGHAIQAGADGTHTWRQPTQEQIKERMRARRA